MSSDKTLFFHSLKLLEHTHVSGTADENIKLMYLYSLPYSLRPVLQRSIQILPLAQVCGYVGRGRINGGIVIGAYSSVITNKQV